jgi:hypothetical protein
MLERFPNELILEVYKHLRPARKDSQAAYGNPTYGSGINDIVSAAAFTSLCLTSRHRGNITTSKINGYLNIRAPSNKFVQQLFLSSTIPTSSGTSCRTLIDCPNCRASTPKAVGWDLSTNCLKTSPNVVFSSRWPDQHDYDIMLESCSG